jgi:hypothetical protein
VRAYISRHQKKTVVRCRKPCNRVRHRPLKDQKHPLFSGRNPERVMVYIACLVWGMPVPLCRATACHTHRRLSIDLNKLMCEVAAAFNARQAAVEQGTWETVQADEMAIGGRKYHVGQSPRVMEATFTCTAVARVHWGHVRPTPRTQYKMRTLKTLRTVIVDRDVVIVCVVMGSVESGAAFAEMPTPRIPAVV